MPDDSARRALKGTRFGDVRWFAEVGSTNTVLAGMARAGAPEGVVVVAGHQTAGRGRLGRSWEEEPGSSLLLSVLLRPHLPPTHAPLLTIAMALAASDACAEVAGATPLLKWPNDLTVDGRKLAGILGEMVPVTGDTRLAAVVGIGLNLKAGARLPPEGVALDEVAARPADRTALLVALLRRLDARYAAFERPDGSARLLDDYRARSATLGRPVRVELPSSTVEGVAVDVTAEGHLSVDTPAGRHVVLSGDVVHLHPTAGGC